MESSLGSYDLEKHRTLSSTPLREPPRLSYIIHFHRECLVMLSTNGTVLDVELLLPLEVSWTLYYEE
ncbi:hypothetical protein M378DRAFT_158375 [Amanita muscaria Koide BX008]|uniref:Uncharacterized protein n=1 Tax=Amanita muscaria (strain Koide BX008) TaxID=946122 RepID=A0A0C2SYI5_AMAMK|nr:hypothetical protein M378DRAFT_158375 [Amanita muscaria Koide BX008]